MSISFNGKSLRKGRCVIFFVVCFALVNLFFGGFNANATEKTMTDDMYAVVVEQGDSLWSLIEDNYTGQDSNRKIIKRVKEINCLRSSTIYAGDVVLIPVR